MINSSPGDETRYPLFTPLQAALLEEKRAREKLREKLTRRDAETMESSARRLGELRAQLDEARGQISGSGAAAEEARKEVRQGTTESESG